MRRLIHFCLKVGYDYVWAHPVIDFPHKRLGAQDTASLPHEQRMWVNEHEGIIMDWEDFEKYPWPTPESIDYSYVEFMAKHVPEGMQVITGTSGILEWVMWLMGFVPFSMALYEQPDLVEAMFERIGSLFEITYKNLVEIPNVGAIVFADDMGYKSGTFIKPQQMRHFVFPRQQRLAEITHAKGLPFFMHACGNLKLIMDDLIDDVKIDGKHSFEDIYLSAVEAKRLYGDRISILGGVDMDVISRASEEEVRAYTRRLLEACMPGGGYALGTGNTVANYIPVDNYIAMLDEGMKYGYY
jgi:uroporphyrinogen decarboxylase